MTWGNNHETNPAWLPRYLLHLANAAGAYDGGVGVIDVFGFPRRHSALMYCCQSCSARAHLHLQSKFRYFLAVEGCIWQRQDRDIVNAGAGSGGDIHWEKQTNISLDFLSRMDGKTLWGGDVERPKKEEVQIDQRIHV